MSEARAPAPTLGELASCFLQIALSSFGGGLSAWTRRIVVEQRRWMNDEQFLSALTIARLFPGPNQVNMAVYVGVHFRGLPGALAALGRAARRAAGDPRRPRLGLLPLPRRARAARDVERRGRGGGRDGAVDGRQVVGNYLRQPAALVFAAGAFAAVSVLHVSLPVVVVVLAPLAMAWYWPRGALTRRGRRCTVRTGLARC